MIPRLRTASRLALLVAALGLAACDTAEERAENHYQRGMELLAEGDAERAMIEFRNVFRLDDSHLPALTEFAGLLRDQGDVKGAFGHYLRVVELEPRNLAAQIALAEMSLQVQDFESAEIHVMQAFGVDPASAQVRALKATVDYRKDEDRPAAVALAESALADAPANIPARMVVIADRLSNDDTVAALELIDAGLTQSPGDEGLHLVRLATLEKQGDIPAVGAELMEMATLFPDNEGVRDALIQFHLREGNTDAAEAVLRETAARSPDDPDPALIVVQFLLELRGADAARTELETLIADAANPRPYQRALAGLDFARGEPDTAIAAVEALLDGTEPSDETRELQVTLAEMLAATGRAAESEALVATVLAEDPTQVGALKIRARAEIAADRPESAIRDMRTALSRDPRDPDIMTIMALAHEREGARGLMGERLALAVETSNRRAAESLRYANYLMQEGRIGPAESTVLDALRRDPENRDLLDLLGRIHLSREDWTRADQVAGLLRAQGDPVSAAMADALTTESLRGQGRGAETLAMLEGLAGQGDNAAAMVELVRAQVATGDIPAARAYLDGVLAEDPASVPARFLMAGIEALDGTPEAAETLYRTVIADAPEMARTYQALFTLLAAQGRVDEAEAALEAGIAAADDPAQLLFTRAGLQEARGDIPGAIASYEDLYARDSGVLVVANNLASLLTQQGLEAGTDTATSVETLDRAHAIARRLRDSEVPHFRDTYGWILHLRGDSASALDYLVPASEALPDNALVQVHRGEAELALGRVEAAQASFTRALAAHEAGSPLPKPAALHDRLAELAALPAAPLGEALTPDSGG
jgi:tetratricopeptide (TPR) repeat protein